MKVKHGGGAVSSIVSGKSKIAMGGAKSRPALRIS
jgi:hypothetical protein